MAARRSTQSRRRRSGFVRDDILYFSFQLAERLGKTYQELMAGEAGPLAYSELVQWSAYTNVRNAREEEAAKALARKHQG
ncbi:hypothetical protein GCM10010423_65120 [Streptomyces levis]|uniref:Uncharacterized protein n=1 Tax=Streptomyces levis TaxID=285566 RepID=A0ABN3P273_9ACTN